MTMLEKAARSVFECKIESGDLFDVCDASARNIARAVLMAVREMPVATQRAIFDARDGFVHEIDIPSVLEMGIDTILNEGEA